MSKTTKIWKIEVCKVGYKWGWVGLDPNHVAIIQSVKTYQKPYNAYRSIYKVVKEVSRHPCVVNTVARSPEWDIRILNTKMEAIATGVRRYKNYQEVSKVAKQVIALFQNLTNKALRAKH